MPPLGPCVLIVSSPVYRRPWLIAVYLAMSIAERCANRCGSAAWTSLEPSRELRTAFDACKRLIVHVVAENDRGYLAQFHGLEAPRANWAWRRATAPCKGLSLYIGQVPDMLRCENSGHSLKTERRSGVEHSGGVILPLIPTR
jgi:hypothetical protein